MGNACGASRSLHVTDVFCRFRKIVGTLQPQQKTNMFVSTGILVQNVAEIKLAQRQSLNQSINQSLSLV